MTYLSRHERRIANSKTLVRYVTPFAVGWLIIAWGLGAPRLEIAAGIATIGFLGGILLHRYEWHTLARITWLLAANAAIFLASLVVHPAGYMSFILLAAAGMPFLIFSTNRKRPIVWGLVALPVLLWFIGWWTDYALLAPFDVGEDMAKHVVAPGTAVTVFGVVLFEFAYFVVISRRYAASLSQAQQRAEVANEAKSALLRSMSHEMRTPLNAITGFSELTREDAGADSPLDRDKVRDRMDAILGASDNLLKMVENMLSYASIAGSEINVNQTVVDLDQQCAKALRRYEDQVSAKNLQLDLSIPKGTQVKADPALLVPAIQQLLDNAIKYTPAGGKIALAAEPAAGNRVKVSICDTGPGFPKGMSDTAFDPFERLEFANGIQSGAGIGMALVRAYVEAMGGKVGIETDRTSGALVWLALDAA
ncbi:sensor histidine kinase [Thalassovita mangrovi]|uniref:histidine kinase n=1 Tax=Thalassovita mangrovi TaxID=2692236 RepID=A0A6L8LLN0_9RHOB|nr:HAMP domain-containing sensor histidine kinase [Thalassovita mangrovi]MYM56884.1 hypothetical protein [Thalassovita mangrovi]